TIVLEKAARLLRDTVEASMSEVSKSDSEILKKLKDHYTACMDEAQVAKQDLRPLKATTEKNQRPYGQT
ncbi:MAG: hypothetical protein M1823_008402, partial [Watsoniomyces obsoletus]